MYLAHGLFVSESRDWIAFCGVSGFNQQATNATRAKINDEPPWTTGSLELTP
jgi:hypothetical protein